MYKEHFHFLNRHEGMKDITKINVYIADTSVTKVTQEPDYESGDLLSDCGGQMGLWIGMSLLSAGEILQLVVDFFYAIKFRWQAKQIKPVEKLCTSRNQSMASDVSYDYPKEHSFDHVDSSDKKVQKMPIEPEPDDSADDETCQTDDKYCKNIEDAKETHSTLASQSEK